MKSEDGMLFPLLLFNYYLLTQYVCESFEKLMQLSWKDKSFYVSLYKLHHRKLWLVQQTSSTG